MSDNTGSCAVKCWGTAAVLGLLVLVLTRHLGLFPAIVLGLLTFGLLGLLFNWMFCASVPKRGEGASKAVATTSTPTGSSSAAATTAGSGAGATEPKATPTADTATAQPVAEKAASETPSQAPAESAAVETSGASAPVIKASKALSGQDDLATRKGSWKYEAEAVAEKPAKAKAASGDPAPSGAEQDNVDRDGDGKREGTDEGTKPAMLTGPRAGGADNLKEIKGIGPKLEQLCNSLGVYHFDQIAAWTKDELAWVDSNLVGFKGRATRDDWVGQASILASGGETEFSQRVEDGKVY